ncbi:hypothetical protein DRN69_03250 [Candidatus Pacearchaeota archaeon]|nr:MAG: hypothetical protein DRN69_03250 [Candidatus Pacearchaeota archaeon]
MDVSHEALLPLKIEYHFKETFIWSFSGVILLVLSSLFNIIDLLITKWAYIGWFRQYLIRSMMSISFFPLAIGFGMIFSNFFVGFIRREGELVRNWLIVYSVAEIISLFTLSTIVLGAFTLLAIIFGKLVAFIYLDRVFLKLKKNDEVKINFSLLYPLFGSYRIVVAIVVGVAANVRDYETELYLTAANATLEALFTFLIGLKLLLDLLKIRSYINSKRKKK